MKKLMTSHCWGLRCHKTYKSCVAPRAWGMDKTTWDEEKQNIFNLERRYRNLMDLFKPKRLKRFDLDFNIYSRSSKGFRHVTSVDKWRFV